MNDPGLVLLLLFTIPVMLLFGARFILAIKEERTQYKGLYYQRDRDPVMYWGLSAFYLAVFISILVALIGVFLYQVFGIRLFGRAD